MNNDGKVLAKHHFNFIFFTLRDSGKNDTLEMFHLQRLSAAFQHKTYALGFTRIYAHNRLRGKQARLGVVREINNFGVQQLCFSIRVFNIHAGPLLVFIDNKQRGIRHHPGSHTVK